MNGIAFMTSPIGDLSVNSDGLRKAVDTISELQADNLRLQKERDAYKRVKDYWDGLYGTGLDIANFHLSGNFEPFDTFWEEAESEFNTGCEQVVYDKDVIQYLDAQDIDDVIAFSDGLDIRFKEGTTSLIMPIPEGNMLVNEGDYIVKRKDGVIHPYKPNVFSARYKLVINGDEHA